VLTSPSLWGPSGNDSGLCDVTSLTSLAQSGRRHSVDTWERAQRNLSGRRRGGRWLTTLADAVAARSPHRRQQLQALCDTVAVGGFDFCKQSSSLAWDGGSAGVASKLTLEVRVTVAH
jgi:hypothetical protein